MDIPKLSRTERLILELLSGEEMFGLQLVEQSKGVLKRGTVYVTLGRMQDKGYVESWTEKQPAGAIGLPRRLYRPTAYGAARPRGVGIRRAHVQIESEARLMPGRTLHRFATHLCSAKTLERVVEPAIADLQKEYAAARSASSRVWALLLGYLAVLKVMALCAASVPSSGDDRRAVASALAWSTVMFVVVFALLVLLPLYSFQNIPRGWYAATTLVPQALPLAIPIGVVFGIALGLNARRATEYREEDAGIRARRIRVELRHPRLGDACGQSGLQGVIDSETVGQWISRRDHGALDGSQRDEARRAAPTDHEVLGAGRPETRTSLWIPVSSAFLAGRGDAGACERAARCADQPPRIARHVRIRYVSPLWGVDLHWRSTRGLQSRRPECCGDRTPIPRRMAAEHRDRRTRDRYCIFAVFFVASWFNRRIF